LSEMMRIPNAIEQVVGSLVDQLMPLAIFATYVWLGNTMSVSSTVLARLMINRVKQPVNKMINFYSRWIDVQ